MAYRFASTIILKTVGELKNLNVKANKNLQAVFHSSVAKSKTKKSPPMSMRKIILGISALGVSGGVYGYMTAMPERNRNLSNELIELADTYVIANPPIIKSSRKVEGPAKDSGLEIKLYQYQTCPFCCKVRAFLDYYGFPYDIIEVNPVMRQQIKFSKYKKVPIIIAHEHKTQQTHQLNDSSAITSILGTYLMNKQDGLNGILKYYLPVSYESENGQKVTEVLNQYFLMYEENNNLDKTDDELKNERQWRKWADQEFVHYLSPNIYRTSEEALQAFNYFSEVGEWEKNFSSFERHVVIYVGATAMYFIGKRLRKKYGLKEDVRESLYDVCRMWLKAVGKSQFLGGTTPNLADLAVYGMLSSIEGCITFKDLLQNTNIGPWYFRVQKSVKNHDGYYQLHPKL